MESKTSKIWRDKEQCSNEAQNSIPYCDTGQNTNKIQNLNYEKASVRRNNKKRVAIGDQEPVVVVFRYLYRRRHDDEFSDRSVGR